MAAKLSVNNGGPAIPVMPINELVAPCRRPWPLGPTRFDITPINDGLNTPSWRIDDNRDPDQPRRGRQAVEREPDGAGCRADGEGRARAEPLDHRADDAALHHHVRDPDDGKRESDLLGAPLQHIAGPEHEHARIHGVAKVIQEAYAGERQQFSMRTQELQRPHRIRAGPTEGGTLLRRQRLRQDKEAVERVHQGKPTRDPERQSWVGVAKHTAERRADDEPETPRRTHDAERRRTILGLGDVGDVGRRRREARGRHA